jgi:hypothetical protein
MTTADPVAAILESYMRSLNITREQALVEYDLEVYSDIYKDIHGVRPRWAYESFRAMTAEQRAAAIMAL